jgi:hypothetical protein
MTNHVYVLGLAASVLGIAVSTQAQDKPIRPPAATTARITPLKVQIVMSKYRGEKKISNVPYTLSVNADDGGFAGVRSGAQVPVPQMSGASGATPPPGVPLIQPIQYRDIGTKIDCRASSTENGRFKLEITVEDTSMYANGETAENAPKLQGVPTFRSYASSNTLLLADGQTSEFTSAADTINGEVVKIAVTLTVVK